MSDTENQNAEVSYETMDDVPRQYFAPDQGEAAQMEMLRIGEIPGVEIKSNFDLENDGLPEGYGLRILPVGQRVKIDDKGNTKNRTIAIGLFGVPSFETIAALPNGRDFLEDAMLSAFDQKLTAAVRPNASGNEGNPPRQINEFIESRRGEANKAFNELAPDFVKGLKKVGVSPMSVNILRQVLSSKAYAESQFPRIAQSKWEGVLNSMISKAEAAGHSTAGLKDWLATRDEAELRRADDFDLDALESLVAAE